MNRKDIYSNKKWLFFLNIVQQDKEGAKERIRKLIANYEKNIKEKGRDNEINETQVKGAFIRHPNRNLN